MWSVRLQEAKCEAARLGAAALLVRHLAMGECTALACKALQKLAGVLAGRATLAAAGGVAELAGALCGAAAAEAAACLEVGMAVLFRVLCQDKPILFKLAGVRLPVCSPLKGEQDLISTKAMLASMKQGAGWGLVGR